MARTRPLNKSLLDTDIFSEITKGHESDRRRPRHGLPQGVFPYTISAVTVMEVIRGYQKKQATGDCKTS